MGKIIVKSSKISDIFIAISNDEIITNENFIIESSIHKSKFKLNLDMDYTQAVSNSTSSNLFITEVGNSISEDMISYINSSQGVASSNLIYDNNALTIDYDYTISNSNIEFLDQNKTYNIDFRFNKRTILSNDINITDPTSSISNSYTGSNSLDLYQNVMVLDDLRAYLIDSNDTLYIYPNNGSNDKGIGSTSVSGSNGLFHPYESSGTFGYSPNESLGTDITFNINSLKGSLYKPSFPNLPSFNIDLTNKINTIMCRCDNLPNNDNIDVTNPTLLDYDIYVPIFNDYTNGDTVPTASLVIGGVNGSVTIDWNGGIGGRFNIEYNMSDFTTLSDGSHNGTLSITLDGSTLTYDETWTIVS